MLACVSVEQEKQWRLIEYIKRKHMHMLNSCTLMILVSLKDLYSVRYHSPLYKMHSFFFFHCHVDRSQGYFSCLYPFSPMWSHIPRTSQPEWIINTSSSTCQNWAAEDGFYLSFSPSRFKKHSCNPKVKKSQDDQLTFSEHIKAITQFCNIMVHKFFSWSQLPNQPFFFSDCRGWDFFILLHLTLNHK